MSGKITPLTLLQLTYNNDPDRLNGLDIIVEEVNKVSERWQEFVEKNFVPKPDSKERIKVLEALDYLVDNLDYQRDPKFDFKLDRINTIIEYIEKQGQ